MAAVEVLGKTHWTITPSVRRKLDKWVLREVRSDRFWPSCPVCGHDQPKLKFKDLIGGRRTRKMHCPQCKSSGKEELVYEERFPA